MPRITEPPEQCCKQPSNTEAGTAPECYWMQFRNKIRIIHENFFHFIRNYCFRGTIQFLKLILHDQKHYEGVEIYKEFEALGFEPQQRMVGGTNAKRERNDS